MKSQRVKTNIDFFIESAKTSLNADFWEVQAYRGN